MQTSETTPRRRRGNNVELYDEQEQEEMIRGLERTNVTTGRLFCWIFATASFLIALLFVLFAVLGVPVPAASTIPSSFSFFQFLFHWSGGGGKVFQRLIHLVIASGFIMVMFRVVTVAKSLNSERSPFKHVSVQLREASTPDSNATPVPHNRLMERRSRLIGFFIPLAISVLLVVSHLRVMIDSLRFRHEYGMNWWAFVLPLALPVFTLLAEYGIAIIRDGARQVKDLWNYTYSFKKA